MNTYFNEFTSKPEKLQGNGAFEKIPAGALCGNGDLSVVFDNDETDLIIHISKCDFWKFTPGARNDGGIKAVGNIRIKNIDLSEYNIKQYFNEGLLKCKFSDTEIEFFVAEENLICFEIKSPASTNTPAVSIEMPDTCNSVNSQHTENGFNCYTREFKGEKINIETAVTVCLKKIETNKSDGCNISRYGVFVCTNFDSSNHSEKAAEMASGCDYDIDKLKTRENGRNSLILQK